MNKVIVICGPTAVGKTKISIEIAKKYNLDIISGDSVALYKRLDIGSAKPTLKEMDGVKHYLISEVDPAVQFSVMDFQYEARSIMDKNKVSLIAGGTGLYIQSALFDYQFEAKRRDEDFEKKYEHLSNDELYQILLDKDPNLDTTKIHKNNRKRVLRALEIILDTNKSVSEFNNKKIPLYDYFIVYLNLSNRELLYKKIDDRVDEMFEAGLLNEVTCLYNDSIYPNAIGYKEFIPYFRGEVSLDSVKEEIKKNSRHLAKRQMTWFRNQLTSHFYDVNLNDINVTIKEIENDIDEFLRK